MNNYMDNNFDVLICPFCGRNNFKRKGDLSLHIKYCKENPNRFEHFNKGHKHSDETKQKIADRYYPKGEEHTRYGKHLSDETKQKISNSNKGKKLSDEHKRQISIFMKGRFTGENNPMYGKKLSDETKQKISDAVSGEKNGFYGKTHSIETKQKISATSAGRNLGVPRTEYVKHKISQKHLSTETKQKIYNAKKKNNSFHTSKIETELKNYFDSNNIKYISQYKSDLYPFCCDFYFPDKDLYVEIQGNWTHGGKPYIETDPDCIKQLELWKSKATKFYDNAIETWTVRDVKKRNIAKQNNLNWIEIFSNDLETCINIIIDKI